MPSFKSSTVYGFGEGAPRGGNGLLGPTNSPTRYHGGIGLPGTEEQRQVAIDVIQFTLDIGGIIEPTPFCDISSGLISLGRRDWLGAGISALSIIPYIGDLAKVGKLPKYLKSIQRAVHLASEDARFAEHLRPAFRKIKELLDDLPLRSLPESARGTIAQIRKLVDDFLKGAKLPAGPVMKALERLPEHLKAPFEKAAGLPLLRNPRKLAKHHGPVTEQALIDEILKVSEKKQAKGFELVKKGEHGVAGSESKFHGGGPERSDVYLRRVVGEDGKQYYESIRIDRRLENPRLGTPSPHPKNPKQLTQGEIRKLEPGKTPGQRQMEDRFPRREHHTLGETLDPATGTPRSTPEIADHLNSGRAYKGDFSHWHHERFPATPENLENYLGNSGVVKGLQKFDSGGIEVIRPKHIPGPPKS